MSKPKPKFPKRVVLGIGWPGWTPNDDQESVAIFEDNIGLTAPIRLKAPDLIMCEKKGCPKYRLVLERVDRRKK